MHFRNGRKEINLTENTYIRTLSPQHFDILDGNIWQNRVVVHGKTVGLDGIGVGTLP